MELGTFETGKKKKQNKRDFHVLQQWTFILSILNDNHSQNKLFYLNESNSISNKLY